MNRLVIWGTVAAVGVGILVAAKLRSGSSDLPTTASNSKAISAADFGEAYPFTVDGSIECNSGAIVFRSGSNVYAVNGTAQSKYKGTAKPLEQVWRDDPKLPGAKVNVAPVMSVGEKLCN